MKDLLRCALVAAACVSLVAGCGQGAVRVNPPTSAGEAAAACRALHDHLPREVMGKDRRSTEPRSPYVAAWGDPPIVLRCGVRRPAALTPTSQLAVVNGVSWLPIPERHPRRLVTVGRAAYVEVLVPKTYQPPANTLVDLAGPVKRSVPERAGS
ncbi:MAG: DUF3515 domain-containing protein [Streptosporangiaceae bacterium]